MAKQNMIAVVMMFVALTVVSVMFIANMGDMGTEYSENSTYAQTQARASGLFGTAPIFIIPLAIIIAVVLIFITIKWAFSQGKGYY